MRPIATKSARPSASDLLGLVRLEPAERDDRNVDAASDLGGVDREIADAMGRVRIGGAGCHIEVRVGGDVHRVETGGDRELDHRELIVERLAVLLVVFERVDAHPERVVVADPGTNRADDLQQQPGAVLDRTAPSVVPTVDRRG